MRRFFAIALLLLLPSAVFSQLATVRGFLYDKSTAEPMIFNAVVLKGTKYGVQTDVNGYFSITQIPPGKYTLASYSVGFDTLMMEVELKADEILTKKLFLIKKVTELNELVVSADKTERKNDVKISVNKVTSREIKKLPTVGGEPDLAQYLQVIPGVIFTGDQGGQLYIRGGSPVMNRVIIDGMLIYNPFHSIGLYSVFDADAIRNADVYTGGFGAQYGGRISSVMDITTRDGNKKRISGKASASTFGSKLLLEGPIFKEKEDGSAASSFLLSAKNSYLSRSSKIFYPNANEQQGLPYDFLDIYAKASVSTGNGSKASIFAMRYQDNAKFLGVADLNWVTNGIGGNFVVVPPGTKTLIKGYFGYSNYTVSLLESNNKPRSSGIDGFNFGFDFINFSGKNEVNYGVEAIGNKTTFEFTNLSNSIQSNFEASNTELAGYIRYKMNFGRVIFDPSFRIHYYASISEPSIEPRAGLKVIITDNIRFKAAGGLYSQNLYSTSSDRDVVNIFYGFLSSPENIQNTFRQMDGTYSDVNSRLQKSWHSIAGFEFDLGKNTLLNIELYNKQFSQLINVNPKKLFDDVAANSNIPDSLKKDLIVETGFARGIDCNLKYDYNRLYIWAVYSLGFVTRYDGNLQYMPHFDRRHNVNLVVSYELGKRRDWEINIRMNYGSGFPFTRSQGYFNNLQVADGISQSVANSNNSIGIIYGPLNKGRLPDYHRLDINVKKKFVLGENTLLEVNAGATNLYNRQNIFYKDRITNKELYQLPFLPTLSANITF
jgi:hypothetical protein